MLLWTDTRPRLSPPRNDDVVKHNDFARQFDSCPATLLSRWCGNSIGVGRPIESSTRFDRRIEPWIGHPENSRHHCFRSFVPEVAMIFDVARIDSHIPIRHIHHPDTFYLPKIELPIGSIQSEDVGRKVVLQVCFQRRKTLRRSNRSLEVKRNVVDQHFVVARSQRIRPLFALHRSLRSRRWNVVEGLCCRSEGGADGNPRSVAQSSVDVMETKSGRVRSVFRLYKAAIICRARIELDTGLITIISPPACRDRRQHVHGSQH